MVSIVEFRPSEDLSAFVNCYSEGVYNVGDQDSARLKVIPNGCLELIIHLDEQHCSLHDGQAWSRSPDYLILGLLTRHYEVRFQHRVPVFSIRFRPEALFTLFGIPGQELIQGYEDSSAIFGVRFRDFCHRIREAKNSTERILSTEKYLRQRLGNVRDKEDYVRVALNRIRKNENTSIHEVVEDLHVSRRQLERRFKNQVGISPKQYLRLMRINKVMQFLQHGKSMDLTSVAYHCGYFDQAHFIRDFKSITGENPKVFLSDEHHFIVLPAYQELAS